MQKVALLNKEDKIVLFTNTGTKRSMHPSIIEKDFWVCYILDYLFHRSPWKEAFIFKGGTSLSKAYHVIKRFSEDIDLILDWRLVNDLKSDPWEDRSKTQQDKFNKHINHEAAVFLAEKFVPIMKQDLEYELKCEINIMIDPEDEQTVNFAYPQIFPDQYLRPEIRLEIGPLAEWLPHHEQRIKPYVADEYSHIFEKTETTVQTVDAERTFWEKTTILHKVANRDISKPFPRRYARHYYDLYCMYLSEIKTRAFEQKGLLERDVMFKKKFYYSGTAGYETAKIGTLQLLPKEEDMQALENDYSQMKEMFFGEVPEFEKIIEVISALQNEINGLSNL